MAQPPDPALSRTLRELTRGLAEAPDAQVARAVALVDGLPARGDADRLIAPLRPRLARLRPRRPLRFTRLLFLPLDPVIVAPAVWRPNAPTIPRSALGAMATTVRAGLPAQVAEIDALIKTVDARSADTVVHMGTLLWPDAAALLFHAPVPVGWEETGLNLRAYPPLVRRTSAVLSHALALEELAAEGVVGITPPRPDPIRAMLADVCRRCPEACGMLVTVLLARLPQCAPLLGSLAAELGPQGEALVRQASQEAAEALLARLENAGGTEGAVTHHDLGDAVQALRRTSLLLNQLAGCPNVPQLQARLKAVRQRFMAGCRQIFAGAITQEFLPALRRGTNMTVLEATARHLRELATDARLLGDDGAYEAPLRQAGEAVVAEASRSPVARARLLEILIGAEAALAFLERCR